MAVTIKVINYTNFIVDKKAAFDTNIKYGLSDLELLNYYRYINNKVYEGDLNTVLVELDLKQKKIDNYKEEIVYNMQYSTYAITAGLSKLKEDMDDSLILSKYDKKEGEFKILRKQRIYDIFFYDCGVMKRYLEIVGGMINISKNIHL